MLDFTEYTKFFIAMLAIVDPIAIIPLYAQLIESYPAEAQRRFARNAALTTVIALLTALFLGQMILNFFGISIASFRIAGGILLMLMALQLMYPSSSNSRALGGGNHLPIDSQIVVPVAIPLLAGPGAFSTVIVYSFKGEAWPHYAAVTLCLLLLGLVVWFFLHIAGPFSRRVSPTGIAVSNKIMGLIMAAISVEFIANGIKQLFEL
jgi:multiple antibiotic resistance protein